MKVKRATTKDRQALWNVIHILSALNHNDTLIDPNSDEELSFDCSVYHFCQDTEDDNEDVAFLKKSLFALLQAYGSGDCEAAALNLDVLMSPENNIIDQDDTVLDFSPELKRNIMTNAQVYAGVADGLDFAEQIIDKHTQSAWISVNEKQPENGQMVLAYSNSFKNGELFVQCVYEDGLFKEYDGFLKPFTATHWMPLPKDPSK